MKFCKDIISGQSSVFVVVDDDDNLSFTSLEIRSNLVTLYSQNDGMTNVSLHVDPLPIYAYGIKGGCNQYVVVPLVMTRVQCPTQSLDIVE